MRTPHCHCHRYQEFKRHLNDANYHYYHHYQSETIIIINIAYSQSVLLFPSAIDMFCIFKLHVYVTFCLFVNVLSSLVHIVITISPPYFASSARSRVYVTFCHFLSSFVEFGQYRHCHLFSGFAFSAKWPHLKQVLA